MPSTITPAFPVAGEFHISLRVADLGRSNSFYSAFFGVSPKHSTERYSTFIVPHLRLNFVLLVNDRGEALDNYSLYHLGLGVAVKAEVIAAHHAAVAAGAEIVKPPRTTWHGTPMHELWLRDPSGYLIEIYALLTDEELAEMPADKEPVFLLDGQTEQPEHQTKEIDHVDPELHDARSGNHST
ncbi:glyoxalase (plasmid) [Sulfuriferula sp. AH1]|nr:glyoxalase [Sulfuriferula sp. AH1]